MSAYTDADERSDNSGRIWESAMRKIGEDHLAKADPMIQPHYIDRDNAYWRKAYETLVAQTGRDLNDGLGIDPRRKDWLPPSARSTPPAPTETVAALSSRPVDDSGGEFSGVNPEATAWRENVRRALDLALMVAEDLSKGYRDSDEEDDFMRCPACKGWIDHYGHTPTCDLVVLEKRAREGLQALAVIPTNLDGEVS